MLRRAAKIAVLSAILGVALANPWVAFPCPVRFVFRVPCPGCGMTRALGEIFRGHFTAAHALHPLVWIVMPLVAFAAIVEAVSYIRTGDFERLSRLKSAKRVTAVVVTLMIAVWVARFFGAFGGPAPV